jgi:hypothetical protein
MPHLLTADAHRCPPPLCSAAAEVAVKDADGEEIFRCAQRDLFRKYNWPAKPKIVAAIQAAAQQ